MNTRGLALTMGLLLILGGMVHGLAQSPPSGLETTLKTITKNAYTVAHSERGWGSEYGLPQSQFSTDENDYYNNSAEFGEVGIYILGMQNLSNPQLAELSIDTQFETKIADTAAQVEKWLWTPEDEAFGVHHKERLPNNGITNVLASIQGIGGASNACEPISFAYNTWGVPKDTITKQTTSQLTSLAGAGHVFLAASYADQAKKGHYVDISKHIADMLLTFIVTPEGENFGVHPSALTDTHGNSIPEGMMPSEFLIKTDSIDTLACTDGGVIKAHENRKTQLAQTALFLTQLGNETHDEKYTRAAEIITKGVLALQECDGSYQDYTRWEGSGAIPNNCTPDDGSAEYEAYPSNVVTNVTRGFLTDTTMILYLFSKANPEEYTSSPHFEKAVKYLLTLEENDQGSGISTNGDPVRHASYSIDVDERPFAQIMLANVFLRASCNENDEGMEARLQSAAYKLITKANVNIPSELDAKITNAISSDVGKDVLAASAAADSWKIISKGCQDCVDGDGDGYIDGVCAGDTVKYDCNDNDASIHPGATETCNNVDDDCDGKIDNGFDADNDNVSTCAIPVDCNDHSNEVYPGASEIIDGVDNDCDGKIDNTGIEVSIQNDLNRGIPGVEVVFIDYGNACANSFATLVSNIPEIKKQCATAGTCTTDSNGTCLAAFKKNGKFQGLADIPGDGQASNPIEFEVGKKYVLLFTSDSNEASGQGTGGEEPINPFTSNPVLLAAIVLILGGVGVYFFLKSKNYKLPSLPSRPKTESGGLGRDTSKPKDGGFKMPKVGIPSLSPKKIASKIVESKPLGGGFEHKMMKPGNFPKKPIFGGKSSMNKPRKVWKDE